MTVAEQGKGGQVRLTRLVLVGAAMMVLAGCEEGAPSWLKPDKAGQSAELGAAPARNSVKLVERDVEAPDVFQVTDMGLWDGRPSLGGVWVAHPDVKEPERVIIRNTAGSKFVIGALFRRARDIPGPALQVSSDAAAALGMLAGAPVQLNVTALRREEAKEATPAAEAAPADAAATLAAPAEIEATTLEPVAGAAAAIDAAEVAQDPTPAPQATVATAPTPAATSSPARASSLAKPFVQIGIFSVEENARNTATAMRQAGMVPTVLEQNSQGKAFWRVIVGPATNASEQAALLKKIKGIGFADAYAVVN